MLSWSLSRLMVVLNAGIYLSQFAFSSALTPVVTSALSPVVGISFSTPSTVTVVPPSTSLPTSTITASPLPSDILAKPFQIHPNGNLTKCLDVRGDVLMNGTPVQIYDCNGSLAQTWVLVPGRGHVGLLGRSFCLDAGSNPANGVGLKIWQCFDNLPAQDWYYTDDRRIALYNQGFCLDLTDGSLTNGNQVQIWKCTDSNTNQIWTYGAFP